LRAALNGAPAPLPGAVKGGDPRRRTLAIAGRVLAERGFERTRLRDVATAAGVSIGFLQNYFETRDSMLEEAFSFMCEEIITRWRRRARLETDPWEKIAGLIEELVGDADPKAHSATWTEFCSSASRHPQLRPPVVRVYDTWRRILVEAIEEGVALGVFRPAMSVRDAADAINAEVDGLHMAMAVGGALMDEKRFRRLALGVASMLLGRSIPDGPDPSQRRIPLPRSRSAQHVKGSEAR
jgi:AcrR family transcriptional regulator